MTRRCILAAVTFVLAGVPAFGQLVEEGTEIIDFDRPEAWAMKYFASAAQPTGMGAPRALAPGEIEVGFEGGWVASLDEAEQRVGFNGTKHEDLNRTSVFGRPRIRFGLPNAFSVGVSWVPPVEVGGAEPNLWSVDVARPFQIADRHRIGARIFALDGSIEADFTCDRATVAAGDDPLRNPFGCQEVSRDEQEMRSTGFEVSWAREPREGGRWEPHVAVATAEMDLNFQINARYGGIVDRIRLEAEGTTVSVMAGLTYFGSDRWRVTGEAFYAPLDVERPTSTSSSDDPLFNVRFLFAYRVRE